MNGQPTSTPASERGAMTILVMFTMLIAFGLSLSLLQHGLSEQRSVSAAQSSLAALHLAEYGLAKAELELKSQIDADGDGLGNMTGVARDSGPLRVSRYDVVAVAGAGDMYTVTATGRHGLSVRRIEIGVEVTTSFAFRHAVFRRQ